MFIIMRNFLNIVREGTIEPGTIHVTVGDGNSIEAGTLLELIPRKPGSTAVTIAGTNVKM